MENNVQGRPFLLKLMMRIEIPISKKFINFPFLGKILKFHTIFVQFTFFGLI